MKLSRKGLNGWFNKRNKFRIIHMRGILFNTQNTSRKKIENDSQKSTRTCFRFFARRKQQGNPVKELESTIKENNNLSLRIVK